MGINLPSALRTDQLFRKIEGILQELILRTRL
jgi:hypothetical protein